MITFLQAIVMGLLQGFSELFPISSLGHSVLVPWVLGWHTLLNSQSQNESFYLSFVVMLHVGTALALLLFYRKTWWRIIKGFFSSLKTRKADSPDAKLAWLLLIATVPTGVIGLTFEHKFRVQFAKPLSAIVFLFINGCILLIGDNYIKSKAAGGRQGGQAQLASTTKHVSDTLTLGRATIIGVAQIGALFAGISRSGITMVSGLYSGLNYEDAARFSFLLATPVIFGAGLIKLPDFFGPLGAGIRLQTLAGGLAAGIAAYFTVRYLDKYFQNKTLRPFGIYCIVASVAMLLLGFARGHF